MRKFDLIPKHLYVNCDKYFPYSTVDVIIRNNGKFILTKRAISPYKGKWYLPGGIIQRGHTMRETSMRVASRNRPQHKNSKVS